MIQGRNEKILDIGYHDEGAYDYAPFGYAVLR